MHTKRFVAGVAFVGALASIIALAISSDLRELLGTRLEITVWQFGALLLLVLLFGVFSTRLRLSTVKKVEGEIFLLPQPRRVVHSDPNGFEEVGVHVLKAGAGSVGVWVYLQGQNHGIRKLWNNRYLFASAKIFDGPYRNVFAIAHGPKTYRRPKGPTWKLWLVNGQGKTATWSYPDGGEFVVGWHHILVRWDHSAHLLEMLIDGQVIISESAYLHYWPDEYPERAYIGTWPNKQELHFANTSLARFKLLPEFVDDAWIKTELEKRPTDAPL